MRLVILLGVFLLFVAGCSQGDPSAERQEQPEEPPVVKGPDYEVVDVVPLEESDPEFYEGPIEEAGIPAVEVKVQVDDRPAIQPAYEDATNTLTDYDILNLDFYRDEELLDELVYFGTAEAQRAYQEEAMANLRELTETTVPPVTVYDSSPEATMSSPPSSAPATTPTP